MLPAKQTHVLRSRLLQGGDYFAVVVNYGIIGVAVFHGTFTHQAESQGSSAEDVSQASFYLIMLMNSLTELLDATRQLGEVAGHTKRVCDFMHQMESVATGVQGPPRRPHQRMSPFTPRRQPAALVVSSEAHAAHACTPTFVMEAADGSGRARAVRRVLSDTLNRRRPSGEELDMWQSKDSLTSAFGGTLPDHLKRQAATLLPPTTGTLSDGFPLEVSIHRLGSQELREIVGNVFPDVPLGASLLAVCTFQPVPVTGPALLRAAQVLLPRVCCS